MTVADRAPSQRPFHTSAVKIVQAFVKEDWPGIRDSLLKVYPSL